MARALYDLADALEMSGDDDAAFKMRAIRAGARIVDAMQEPVAEVMAAGRLKDVKGIGGGIARRLAELVETGGLAELAALRASTPPGLLEIARVEGIGPKTARMIHTELGVSSLDELEAAARAQALRRLPRMGAKKEEQILGAIGRARVGTGRMRIDKAEREAGPLVDVLRRLPGVARAEIAG